MHAFDKHPSTKVEWADAQETVHAMHCSLSVENMLGCWELIQLTNL